MVGSRFHKMELVLRELIALVVLNQVSKMLPNQISKHVAWMGSSAVPWTAMIMSNFQVLSVKATTLLYIKDVVFEIWEWMAKSGHVCFCSRSCFLAPLLFCFQVRMVHICYASIFRRSPAQSFSTRVHLRSKHWIHHLRWPWEHVTACKGKKKLRSYRVRVLSWKEDGIFESYFPQ